MNEARWRLLWLFAALHNFSGVVVFIAWHDRIYQSAGLAPPSPALHYDTWIAFVFVFGIAYFLVYLDMRRPTARGIGLLGIMGKLASAAPQLAYLLRDPGGIPPIFALAAVTDLLFVALFFWFLRVSRDHAMTTGPSLTGMVETPRHRRSSQ